jgi:Zn-finger nucleic acid-binding protein
MNCPVCRENALITLELNEVEVDYCTVCSGIWLDAGELEILLGEPDKAKILLNSFKRDSADREKLRKCPLCDKKMEKVKVGSSKSSLLIDKCSGGDGLWFDKGELGEIFDGTLDNHRKIKDLLADMFNFKQNQ